jgi:hypothetical protein
MRPGHRRASARLLRLQEIPADLDLLEGSLPAPPAPCDRPPLTPATFRLAAFATPEPAHRPDPAVPVHPPGPGLPPGPAGAPPA